MTCCKCIEHEWIQPLPGEFVDSDGNEYCILHAPLNLRKNADRFKNTVENIITQSMIKDTCQLSGVIFPEDFSLSSISIKDSLPGFDLSYAVFYGNFNADKCTFLGQTLLTCADFKKNASFIGTKFTSNTIFTRSHFRKHVIMKNSISKNIKFEGCRFKSIVSFNNMTCSENFSIKRCVFKNSVTADKSTIEGEASFNNARFRDNVRFDGSTFLGGVVFVYSKFRKNCEYRSCSYGNKFICRVTKFLGDSYFNYSKFNQTTSFHECTFKERIDLGSSIFSDEFNIINAYISGDANFSGSTFLAAADFSSTNFNGNTSFNESIFKMKAKFGIAQIDSWERYFFRRTGDKPKQVIFQKESDFSHAEFGGELYFEKTTFNNTTRFINSRFNSKTVFNNARFNNNISFDGSIISDIMYLWNDHINRIPIDGKISFKNSIITNQVKISHAKLDNFDMFDADLGKFYFYCCEWEKDNDGINCIRTELYPTHDDLQQLESIYRSLKKGSIDNKNDTMASEWHYQEKTTCRKKLSLTNSYNADDIFLKYCLRIYESCSGFGERPARAFIWLSCILILLFYSLYFSKLFTLNNPSEGMSLADRYTVISAWSKMLLFISVSGWDENFFYHFALFISRVLLPVQLALFTMSLRNKLRR